MVDYNGLSFRLNSTNNEYIIKIRILEFDNPQKLETQLKHKLITGDINFFLQNSFDELIKDNFFLSQFSSIQEIYNYFVKIISSQQITIIKPSTTCYYINFYDQEKQFNFMLLLSKITENIKKIRELINQNEEQKKQILRLESEIKQISKIPAINDEKNNYNGQCLEYQSFLSKSGISAQNGEILFKEKNILKENNNNISFFRIPNNFEKETTISDEKEECENFTAFINLNGHSIIVWTIKGKGIFNLKDLYKEELIIQQHAHSNNINCIQYFHDHNKIIDCVISLSKLDNDTLKIWSIDYANNDEIKLIKTFKKQFFNKEIEIFCIFNYSDYNPQNSFLFIYGKTISKKKINQYANNGGKNKEIVCYKLDEDLNIINWEKDDEEEEPIYYKIINNFYKLNYLDIYYDFEKKDINLINCNENNTEIINRLFDNYKGNIFKHSNWNYYKCAFIKEIDGILKLFQASSNGIVIWDINNKRVEVVKDFVNCCPFDLISWNDKYLFVSGYKEIIILEVSDEKIEIKACKNKVTGFSKIRKIITPEGSEIVVTLDNHKLKYWSF